MIFPDRPNVIGPKKIKITFRQKYILQGEMIPVISGLVSHLVNLEGNDNWGRGRLVWRGITLLIGHHHLCHVKEKGYNFKLFDNAVNPCHPPTFVLSLSARGCSVFIVNDQLTISHLHSWTAVKSKTLEVRTTFNVSMHFRRN